MSRDNIDYYDFNLNFFFQEVKSTSADEAKAIAPFIRDFLEIIQDVVVPPSGESKEASFAREKQAISLYHEIKNGVSKLFPDYFADDEDDYSYTAGLKELKTFLESNCKAKFSTAYLEL